VRHIRAEDITRIESEAGVVATLVYHPEFCFYSENLLPNHFFNKENRYIYVAICNMAQRGVTCIDSYGIIQALQSKESTAPYADELTVTQLNDFIDSSENLARHTVEEYKLCVENVMDAAFRRDTLQTLKKCEAICFNESVKNIEQHIYRAMDDVMMEFSATNEVPPYCEVIDECWAEIKGRQNTGYAGIPFKFPALNDYATIERGELFIFGAEQKQGKSMMLLNCAVDLLKNDYAILYLDSELNTRLFTARILSHLSGIEYKRLTSGAYTAEEEQRILDAKEWLKTRKFTHIYIPTFDQQSIYTAVKKVNHTQGLDVLIVDYFKGKGEGDAFDSYQELGRFVDMVKNQICGEMNIAGIGAAQATATGKLADSAKIARNASTIAMISDKTPEEIEVDGAECGNKKLRVTVNRNGMQMAQGEYIDLMFDGNHILYEQAKQHIPQTPF
jgi:replicative DNA helicase